MFRRIVEKKESQILCAYMSSASLAACEIIKIGRHAYMSLLVYVYSSFHNGFLNMRKDFGTINNGFPNTREGYSSLICSIITYRYICIFNCNIINRAAEVVYSRSENKYKHFSKIPQLIKRSKDIIGRVQTALKSDSLYSCNTVIYYNMTFKHVINKLHVSNFFW
jgi:hypothetical protein